jgi:hypothetical protein
MATWPSSFALMLDATHTGISMISGHYSTASQRATRCFATLSSKTGSGSQRPIISIGTNAPDYDNFCPALDLDGLQNVYDVVDYIVPPNNPFVDTQVDDIFVNVRQAAVGYSDYVITIEFDGNFQL